MSEKPMEVENCIRALQSVEIGLLGVTMQVVIKSTITHLQDYEKMLRPVNVFRSSENHI